MNSLTDCNPSPCGAEIARPTSVIETIRQRKLFLEQQLVEVNEALTALEANPEIARILHLVTKVGRY